MSYPPTEAGAVSNDSLFSDSVEFDRAEKPEGFAPGDDAVAGEQENTTRGLPRPVDFGEESHAELQSAAYATEDATPAPPPPPPTSAVMKPRKTGTEQPKRWEPVDLAVPPNDPNDEFDIGTARKPVYHDESDAKPKVQFQNSEPDMKGEVTNCFDEPGLLYRIVDKKNKTWAFYNDSLAFEVHVVCTFGKNSKLEALENTRITRNANGEFVAEVVVYPCETELFVKGFVNGFTSKLSAQPLSDEYLASRSEAQWQYTIQSEMDAIRAIAGDVTDPEAILQICLDNDLPFVDLSFPPVQSSIELGASKPFKQLPWARPRMYLAPELHDQVRLFRNGVSPGDVDQGELGDCWLMCALATHAEDQNAVMNMFRHPKGADHAKRERAIGAYRVTFNKNGIWRSVIVDDYLPVVANTPKFARSMDKCEIWPSILEKAFAKLHRSYAMIQSGDPVHALTDMTGCPSLRFDDAFVEAASSGGHDLFKQWVDYTNAGYQVIATTPGKAPAITPGSHNVPDFTEEPELGEALAGTGLLPGHAYTVLGAYEFERERVRLVHLRNAWPYGPEYDGDWSRSSPLWQQHAAIANAVPYDPNDTTSMWMPWETVLKYFNGGGVHFTQKGNFDYRVPITFADCRPSVVFRVTVKAPTRVILTMSNMDHRGMHAEQAGSADADPNNTDYPPVMLSLSAPVEGQVDAYRVVMNTSADPMQPSPSKWTFLQAREIAMVLDLEPSSSPYIIVPRLMESEGTVGRDSGENYEEVVNQIHFANDYTKSFPNEDNTEKKEVPVTVGLISATAFDEVSGATVELCKMSESNSVFENFPKFPTDDVEPNADIYFQTKDPTLGYPEEKVGSAFF